MSSIIASNFKPATLRDILIEDIQDLYSAETCRTKALEKMVVAASNESLQKIFHRHWEAGKKHVLRLEQAAKSLGIPPEGKHCSGMMGITLDMEVMIRSRPSSIRDIQLVCTAQKMTHYKLVGYGSACAVAKLLKLEAVAKQMQATLAEENICKAELSALGGDTSYASFGSTSQYTAGLRKAI